MTIPEDISPEAFEQLVRDCLVHLYDYGFLREQLLLKWLVPESNGAAQVQIFRQIVTESIEKLRPETGATYHSKQARIYNILLLRYIDQQQPQDVMQQLAISERQFYRDHPRAIQTLSQLLWERVTGAAMPSDNTPTAPGDISVESEVQRVRNKQSRIDLRELLQGAMQAVHGLAGQHGALVALNLESPLMVAGLSGGVLRQAVLLIMSQLLMRLVSGGRMLLGCEIEAQQTCRIIFNLQGEFVLEDPSALEQVLTSNKSLQTLIESLEGTLHIEAIEGGYRVTLNVPVDQQTVLLIDDNPGMIDLFQRWLAGYPYHVLTANDGEQAIQIARQTHPDVIILDVMLPGMDGWEVLQNLKNHPATSGIPVIVCSVLDACELALSLGADECLMKPPSQAAFLELMARWQA